MKQYNANNINSQETIERCPHDEENPYAQINNKLIRDESISPACRWLLIYLLSNKNGWKITLPQVTAHVRNFLGRDKVRALFREAITSGYMKKDEILIPGPLGRGKLKRGRYYVSETPKFKKCLLRTDFQAADGTSIKNNIYKKDQDKKENRSSQAPPLSPLRKKEKETKQEVMPGVWLTPSQQEAILKKCNGDKDKLHKIYTKLSDWKIGKGITGGKNDYAAIVNWVISAVNNEKTNSAYQADKEKGDRLLAENIWNRFKNSRVDISLSAKYIEFINGVNAPSVVLEFGSKDFRIKALEQLRKRKLKTDDL